MYINNRQMEIDLWLEKRKLVRTLEKCEPSLLVFKIYSLLYLQYSLYIYINTYTYTYVNINKRGSEKEKRKKENKL